MMQPLDQSIRNQLLGRGINILGYDPIWNSRPDAHVQARHFRLIREAGFQHVRINMHPFSFMGAAPNYEIDPAWLEILDWVMEQCRENGLLAILDLHEFTSMAVDPISLKPKFLAAWRQLSTRYRDADENVLFEILNEPNTNITPELWNEYLKEPVSIIRTGNPDRTLIIGPAFWNGIDFLHKLELPKDDPCIIVTVHYYHPMEFTHQGASWSAEHSEKSGISWQGSEEDMQRLQQDFAAVNNWAHQHHRPIYLGEFGAYERADMHSRVRYLHAVAREAERLGWSWGYWQFDSDFVVYDTKQDHWIEPILNALIPA